MGRTTHTLSSGQVGNLAAAADRAGLSDDWRAYAVMLPDGLSVDDAFTGFAGLLAAADDIKPGLATYAANKRRAVIDAGCTVTVSGTPIPSWADASSQGALTALVVAGTINPALTTSWKGRDGVFYPLDAAGINALALGVMAFVQEAFAHESDALDAIAAGTITSTAQIDAAF